jgi:hypothetical protein
MARLARRLLVGGATLVVASTFGTGSVLATGAVETYFEMPDHIDEHVPSAGAGIHMSGQLSLTVHVPGVGEVLFSECDEEYGGTVYEDGSGTFSSVSFSGPNCMRQACEGGAEADPPFQVEDGLGGERTLHFVHCLEPLGGGEHQECELLLPGFTDPEEDHSYSVEADAVECFAHTGLVIEMTGTWFGADGLEFVPVG